MTEKTKEIRPIDDVRHTLSKMQDQFKMALPPQVPVDRFVRITLTAIQQNPDLLAANRATLYGACMKCAQDGLLPDGREATLQVYNVNIAGKNQPAKYEKQAQYMPMTEGLMKKVRNSGEIANWSIQVVKENDSFEYELGDNERIIHKPARKDRGPTVGAYSIVTFKTGEKSREWMDIDQLNAIRARSKQPDSGPWKTDTDEMNRKTVARRHYKRLPKSTDLDGFMQKIDDLYDFDQQGTIKTVQQEPAASLPSATKRPRGLQHVVDAGAPKEAAPIESEDPAAGLDADATTDAGPDEVI